MLSEITNITPDEMAVLLKRFGPVPDDPDTPITEEEWVNAKVRSWLQAQGVTGHDELVQDKLKAGEDVSAAYQQKRDADMAPGDKAQELEDRAKAARDAAEAEK